MKNIVVKMILEMDKIIDKMIPKTEKIVDKIILSKLNDQGLRIAFWISSVMSKVFLINLLFGVIQNLYVYGLNTYYWKNYEIVPYNWFITLLLSFILPILIDFATYMAIRLISKLIRDKLKYEIDQGSILFTTGAYFIIINCKRVIGIIVSVANLIYQMTWEAEINMLGFLNPLMNTIIPIIYILIGLKYIKMSNYINEKITQ